MVGTGGRNVSSFAGPIRTGSQVRNDKTFGVLRMVLHDSSYEWSFVPIPGQTFTDSGSTACHTSTPDGVVPSVPGGVGAVAVGSSRVDVSWLASTDNVGVSGYEVWRDGVLLTTVSAPVTLFADLTVAAGTSYSYQVQARDAAGNVSGLSSPVVATPVALPVGTFIAEADARVQESAPGTNYASLFLRADGGSDPDVESYMRFTVAGLTEPVQNATLRVYSTNGSSDGPGVYSTSNTWSETGITWSNRPGRSTIAIDDKAAVTTNSWVEYNVTSLITGNGTFSVVFAGISKNGTDFNSREATTNRPELIITTFG